MYFDRFMKKTKLERWHWVKELKVGLSWRRINPKLASELCSASLSSQRWIGWLDNFIAVSGLSICSLALTCYGLHLLCFSLPLQWLWSTDLGPLSWVDSTVPSLYCSVIVTYMKIRCHIANCSCQNVVLAVVLNTPHQKGSSLALNC